MRYIKSTGNNKGTLAHKYRYLMLKLEISHKVTHI